MKKLLAALLFLTGATAAQAQSVPWPGISQVAPYTVWSPAEWTAAWQSKLDVDGLIANYNQLPPLAGNDLIGALSATTPSPIPVPSCSGTSSALTWTSGTGFGCNTFSFAGSGTVTTLSVVPANGFTATVANPTTTPAITLSTTAAGMLKGVSGALTPATPGTDYVPATGGNFHTALTINFPATIAAGTYTFTLGWPWPTGTITSVMFTGVTGTTYTAQPQINGVNIGGCSVIPTAPTTGTTSCTSANTIAQGQALTLVISAVSGAAAGVITLQAMHGEP